VNGPIICGVDESESAKGAARVARALSSELGLGVIFVRVVEPGAPQAKVDAVAERLEGLGAVASTPDCGASWSIAMGHPADGLVAAAKEAEASMIVVGSTGPRSSLLGSVSADVSRRAPCPVIVVPPGADGHAAGRTDGDAGTNAAESGGSVVPVGRNPRGPDFAGGIARFDLATVAPVTAGSGRAGWRSG
jgi:nucleotide-binding universal stress UspA family protein